MRFEQNEAFASVDVVESFDATFMKRRQRVGGRETGEALLFSTDKPAEVQRGREQQTGHRGETGDAKLAGLRCVHVCEESDYSINGCTSGTQTGLNPH